MASDEQQNATTSRGGIGAAKIVLAVVGVLVVGGGALAIFSPGAVQRLFGPPRVELAETYQEKPDSPTFDHSAFDRLLKRHVDEDGWVDYRALAGEADALDGYLAQLAQAPFAKLGRDEKLALLINAYNAFTLRLILDHWPVASIKDIPRAQRWDAVRWNVGGQTLSLNQLEHEQIRPKFKEPRIHFALVCAAVGCPPLRNEAFVAARLDEQLDAQTKYVHRHATWFQFAPEQGVVRLTALYNWYGADFEQVAGSVLGYAAAHDRALSESRGAGGKQRIEWLPYDWTLNTAENQQPR